MTRPSKDRTDKRRKRDNVRVNLSYCKYESIRNIVETLGFVALDDEDEHWDLFWSDLSVSSERVNRMKPFQRMNHFPGMLEICRKGGLSKHIRRMSAYFPDEFSYHPRAFFIPNQIEEFLVALRRNKSKGKGKADTYIVKPSAGAMGRGIFLAQSEKDVDLSDLTTSVAQLYIREPLFLNGYKFDLRLYVLISSVDPLKIYIHKEGIARLATCKYEAPTRRNIKIRNMHLTNYAINKTCDGYVDDGSPDKSLGANCGNNPNLCFELLGFDILLDNKYTPWLLEVNHSPSFNCDTAVDMGVKSAVLTDTINSLQLTAAARHKFNENERRALKDRLYKPKTKNKRPLSAMSKQAALRTAAAALEDALTWFPDGNNPADLCTTEDLGDGKLHATKDASRIGGFEQIFPPLDEEKKKMFKTVLNTAADLFPSEGCVCGYCRRRQMATHSTGYHKGSHSIFSTKNNARPGSATTGKYSSGRISPGLDQVEREGSPSQTQTHRPRRHRRRETPTSTEKSTFRASTPVCSNPAEEKQEPRQSVGHECSKPELSNRQRQLLRTTTYPMYFPQCDKKSQLRRSKSARLPGRRVSRKSEEIGEAAAPAITYAGAIGRKDKNKSFKAAPVKMRSRRNRATAVATAPALSVADWCKKREKSKPKPLTKSTVIAGLKIKNLLPVTTDIMPDYSPRPQLVSRSRKMDRRPSTSNARVDEHLIDSLAIKLLNSKKYTSSLPGSYFATPGTSLKLATRVYGEYKL
ncbi:hypothetical protein BSKO_03027 [Bryopsis sp. KO-2023]|nr:hypothetical protein BSKO_03027 [Bryopsis sp. KO-2023]